jgi:antitoxin ParD1/3/4
MNISLPETMKNWIDEQVERGGYNSASEYICEVLREEQKRRVRAQINTNLREAIASPASPLANDEWETIRREGKKRAELHKKKSARQ